MHKYYLFVVECKVQFAAVKKSYYHRLQLYHEERVVWANEWCCELWTFSQCLLLLHAVPIKRQRRAPAIIFYNGYCFISIIHASSLHFSFHEGSSWCTCGGGCG